MLSGYPIVNVNLKWAVVVALLVELSLLTPDVHNSNPINGKIKWAMNCIEKTKIKKKGRELV